MRRVAAPVARPHRSAFQPHVGHNLPGGWWEGCPCQCGDIPYASDADVTAMASALGWLPPLTVQSHAADMARLHERISELEAELAQADEQLEAVHILKRSGMSSERKRGRKPQEAAA